MEEHTEQNAIVKAEPKGLTREDIEFTGQLKDIHIKSMEVANNLLGKIIDFKNDQQKRQMQMAIYADKSIKWSKNFEEIKENNARMYALLSEQFKDRRDTIDKAFEIIDRGLKENNMEVVLGAFGNLADMVAQSPLREAAETAHKLFESGDISQLDPV